MTLSLRYIVHIISTGVSKVVDPYRALTGFGTHAILDKSIPRCPRESGVDLSPLAGRQAIQLTAFGTLLTRNILIAMQEGTIARLTDKGFGFISREGQEKDLFFHSNELVGVSFDELREGDKVTFEVAESPKGPNAVKVSRVS